MGLIWRNTTLCLLTISLELLIFVSAQQTTCPPLHTRNGVSLECQNPRTGASIECNQNLLPGTVIIYQCAKYYVSPFGNFDNGRLTCLDTGRWSRTTHYDDFTCRLDCGRPTSDLLGNAPVIVFGESSTRENFPWHAAMFRSNGPGTPYQYHCGGSLVNPSNKGYLVVTAAHCVTSALRTLRIRPLEDFKVILGPVSSNYVENQRSPGTQIFDVKAAKIHKNYDYTRAQNDIAIVQLNRTVTLSNFVSPVCFPTLEMANRQVTGMGLIPGFGLDETSKVAHKLNYAKLPVEQNHICNTALRKELTLVEFCAGYPTGASACSGDSGGGLVFMDGNKKRFFVQGIASNVDRNALDLHKYCQNYNTFTKVTSFVDWVYDELERYFSDDDDSSLTQLIQPVKPVESQKEFIVTVYRDINDKSKYEEWRMNGCSEVPENWNVGQYWVNVNGNCMQFFEGRMCSDKSLKLQPTSSSNIFKWNFPAFNTQSVSLCQESSTPISSGGNPNKPIRGPNQGNQASNQGQVGSDYHLVGLKMHNQFRARHGVPQLTLSEALNVQAQNYAEKLLKSDLLIPSNEGGENLFQIRGSGDNLGATVEQAVDIWYDTHNNYNWKFPTATSFAQVVWKSSRELGIGVARQNGRTIVVARYSPPGNIFFGGSDPYRYFKENVLPPVSK